MTAKIEKRGAGIHVISEANGNLSREQITVDTGVLEVGTVLGKITASGKYVQVDLGASDGSENAAGVLWDAVDATDADVEAAAHVREAEVLGSELVYPDGATQNDIDAINAALATLNIIVR